MELLESLLLSRALKITTCGAQLWPIKIYPSIAERFPTEISVGPGQSHGVHGKQNDLTKAERNRAECIPLPIGRAGFA